MRKYQESEMLEILPEKYREDTNMIAISYALRMAIGTILKAGLGTEMRSAIDTLPEELLDYLAVELRTPYYKEFNTLENKISMVHEALLWRMRAGTKGAVDSLAKTILGDAKIVEWFQFEEGEKIPGQFDIQTSEQLKEDGFAEIERLIDETKNASSHLRRIQVEKETIKNAQSLFGLSWDERGEFTNDITINEPKQKYAIGGSFLLGEVSELVESVVIFQKEKEVSGELPMEIMSVDASDSLTVLLETPEESTQRSEEKICFMVLRDTLSVLQ